VVDAGADDVHLAHGHAQRAGDLAVAVLDAVAEAHGAHARIERGPGHHGHGVGVVEQQRALLGHLPDVAAEVEHGGDAALAVEDAARADRVAHALVHAVLERNADVVGESLQAPDAHHVHDVARARESLAAVRRGGDEFLLTATAQSLWRLARSLAGSTPTGGQAPA
jgi:hypothetical protein